MKISPVINQFPKVEKENNRQDLGSISHSSLNAVNFSTTASTTAFINNSTTASTTAYISDVIDNSKIASSIKKVVSNPKFQTSMVIATAVLTLASMAFGLKSSSKLIDKLPQSSKLKASLEPLKSVVAFGCLLGGVSSTTNKDLIGLLDDEIITKSLTKTFNNACKENSIENDDRPKIEVTYNDKLFVIDKKGKVTSKKIPRNYERIVCGGLYDSEKHLIKINADVCKVKIELEDTIAHEIYHAKEAIIRNSISQDEREATVKKVLVDNIKNGDNISIIRSYNEKNNQYETMESPIISSKMKQPLADFVASNLFAKDNSLSKKMEAYYRLKYETKEADRTRVDKQNLEKLSSELADIIAGVEKLSSKNTIHKKNCNSIFTRKSTKEKLLFEYIIALENRYQYFKKQEQNFALKELTPKERASIEKSIASNIQSVEGNVTLAEERKKIEKIENPIIRSIKNTLLGNSLSYELYFNSEEEFFARRSAKQNRLNELEKELKFWQEFGRATYNCNKDKITTKLAFSKSGEFFCTKSVCREMKAINSLLKKDENSYKRHLATRNLRNNPEDLKCMYQYLLVSILPGLVNTTELY